MKVVVLTGRQGRWSSGCELVVKARQFAIAASLTALFVSAGSQAATAGSYRVSMCNAAPGAVNHSWTSFSDDPTHFTTLTACPTGGASGGLTGVAAGDTLGAPGVIAAGARAGWRFDAPAGTTITRLDYARSFGQQAYDDKVPSLRDGAGGLIGAETCQLQASESTCGGGFFDASDPLAAATFAGLSTNALAFGITCVPSGGASVCTDGFSLHEGWFDVYGATVTLSESTAPTLGTSSGSLVDDPWVRGDGALQLADASDPSGIQSLTLALDRGSLTASSPAAAACDFTFAKPCADVAAPARWTVDTTRLTDGAHTAVIAATNAASVQSTRSLPFHTDNTPPTAPTVTPDVGTGWQTSPTIHLTWPLPDQGAGSPIASATVQLCVDGGTCGAAKPADSSSSATATLPAAGSYIANVRLVDEAGNVGAAQSVPLHYDPNPPPSPTALSSSAPSWQSSALVDVRWTAPAQLADAAPIAGARGQLCDLGDGSCGSQLTLDASGLGQVTMPHEGAYSLRLWLVSAAGVGDPSTAISTPILYSVTPPRTQFALLSPTTTSDPGFSATLTSAAGGPAPLAHVLWTLCRGTDCPLSGDAIGGQISGAFPGPGGWTLSATPVDLAGVHGTTATRGFLYSPITPPERGGDRGGSGSSSGGPSGGGGSDSPVTRPRRLDPHLRIVASRLRGPRLVVAVAAVPLAVGALRAKFVYRVDGGRRIGTATVRLRHGRGRLVLRLSGAAGFGTLRVQFAGSAKVKPSSVTACAPAAARVCHQRRQ